MQYNDQIDKTGIVQEVDDICQSDANSYPIEAKTRRAVSAMHRYFTLAWQAARQEDGRTFDDVNQGTDPIETLDLVNGQQDYDITDFTSEILRVLRVELVLDNDHSVVLKRLDKSKVQGALTEYKNTATGSPDEYDIVGTTIKLYSPTNYDKTAGLRFYFNRPATTFLSTDTTKEPGIPSIHHMYIARMISLPYLVEFQKAQKNDIAALIKQDEMDIIDYYSHLEKHKVADPILHR